MKYLLDTNICIYLIKRQPPEVLGRLREAGAGETALSSITVSERYFGAAKSGFPNKNRAALETFLLPFAVLSYDKAAVAVYGQLRADLERTGTPIGSLDLMIAAHAISPDLVLVTNNVREFWRVRGLSVDKWV